MEILRDEGLHDGWQAVKALNIIIVGAGIGGLTTGIALAQTGHRVMILESASEIRDVGAGIQIAPNATRILHRLGVLQEVLERATILERVSVRRYTSDEEIATFPLMPANGVKYGAPMGVIHRGDLQSILLSKALDLGCLILTNHKVIAVDQTFSARIQVHEGLTGTKFWMSSDLIIAADGIKSRIRRQMMTSKSLKDEPIATGDAAYRLLIPKDLVLEDPIALSMANQNIAMRYMGPGGHIMAYPIRDNSLYNIVLLHPAKPESSFEDVWTAKGSREEMFEFYASWSPAIKKWLAHTDEDILEWKLYVYPDLPTWIQGSVALLGDACHPMLPYVAQGAANAMEDAAVLATALTCTSNVPLALKIYESIRKSRAERIAASATTTARNLHLPDGPEQVARDQGLTNPDAAERNPDKWSNSEWQDFMWGVDVMRATTKMWTKLAKVLPLDVQYPHLRKAYAYTLSVDMSHSWLLEQLNNLWTRNRKRIGGRRTRTQRPKRAEWKKARVTGNDWDISLWCSKPMSQNPNYEDAVRLPIVTAQLAMLPAPVHTQEIDDLKAHIADASKSNAFILQAGDCAKKFEYYQPNAIEFKVQLLNQLRSIIAWGTRKPVICVGRMADQYAKPHSILTELINEKAIPSFKGEVVNGHSLHERRDDPDRLLQAYYHSAATLNYMRALDSCRANGRYNRLGGAFDPLVKQQPQGEHKTDHRNEVYYDTSADFLLAGDRTRQLDRAHVEFFRRLTNPIGVKIGRTTALSDLIALL